MVHSCREYTLPRDDPRTRARGWIRDEMSIGKPVAEAGPRNETNNNATRKKVGRR